MDTIVENQDVQEIEEMLKTNIEFASDFKDTEEYKILFVKAKEAYPDMPDFLIQMALLSHLEETHNGPKNI